MFGRLFGRKPATIELRLAALDPFGIRLNPGRSIDEMLASWPAEELAGDPYTLLITLGSEVESGQHQFERFCDRLWYCDTECIEDHGDYVRVAEHMARLAGDALPITDVADAVDLEAGVAWLEFSLDGVRTHWDADVDNDWLDPAILSRFARLLGQRGAGRQFTQLVLDQHMLLGCLGTEQLAAFRKGTGLDWQWVS